MTTTGKTKHIRVFSDFDGTISHPDVGATLFNHFAAYKNYGSVKLWMEHRIDSRECLLRECAYIGATRQELVGKLQEIDLTAGFPEFLELLRDSAIPIHVLSDGLDFYISAFLHKAGINHLDVHSNRALFIHGRLYPLFPHFDAGCGFCGCCKAERIRTLSKPRELKVFIGDGYSDLCAITAADLVFAKADLAKLCQEKGVDYRSFGDFFDVIESFKCDLL